MIPLCFAETGQAQIVRRIGGTPEVRQHLEDLGFHVGGEVTVVNTLGKNLIVKVKECRVAVSDELARKIMLRDVGIGQTAVVVKLHGEGAVKRRIMDMGITKHTPVFVRKTAPLGDPIEITVRGYELSIRKADAEMVEVE